MRSPGGGFDGHVRCCLAVCPRGPSGPDSGYEQSCQEDQVDKKRTIIGRLGLAALVATLGGCGELPDGADDGIETGGKAVPTQPEVEEIQSALRAPSCIRVVGHSYDVWNQVNKYFVQNDCSRWWYVSVDLGGVWPNTGCNFVLAGQIVMFTKGAPWKVRYNGVDQCGT
jgi:hypothetical protein